MRILDKVVNSEGKTDWKKFSAEEKLITENLVLLVGMLYKMCQVKLVKQSEDSTNQNVVNIKEIKDVQMEADMLMDEIA